VSQDVHNLAGAYALDALDEVERLLFERHLASCAACRAEVDEFRLTASRLGAAVGRARRAVDRAAGRAGPEGF